MEQVTFAWRAHSTFAEHNAALTSSPGRVGIAGMALVFLSPLSVEVQSLAILPYPLMIWWDLWRALLKSLLLERLLHGVERIHVQQV